MGMKHIPDGGEFEYPTDFGFHGSASNKADHEAPVSDSERGVPPAGRRGVAPESMPMEHVAKPLSGRNSGGEAYAEGGHVEHHADGRRTHHHGDGTHTIHHTDGRMVHHHADGSHSIHHPDGRVMEHHAHGGHSVHHPDGMVEHHHMDGGREMHHPDGSVDRHDMSEYAHGGRAGGDMAQDKAMVKKAFKQHENAEHGGMHEELHLARGGHAGMTGARLPRGMKPVAERTHSPINTPPRNPKNSMTPRNMMPGGQMGYGMQPSAEPDDAGSDQGIPQLSKGGRAPGC